MNKQELIATLPESVRYLNWTEPKESDRWSDGSVLLAALRVRDRISQKTYWELSIVTIKIDVFDEHSYFELEVEGEVWGWDYDDIDLYVHIF